MSPVSVNLHATAIALSVDADGPLEGVLLLGESGSGKTSTALRLISECPYQRTTLVADDLVELEEHSGRLMAIGPDRLKGRAEVRGAGLIRPRHSSQVLLCCAITLKKGERLAQHPPLSPLGANGPSLPHYTLHDPSGLKLLVRAVLTGHSLADTVD